MEVDSNVAPDHSDDSGSAEQLVDEMLQGAKAAVAADANGADVPPSASEPAAPTSEAVPETAAAPTADEGQQAAAPNSNAPHPLPSRPEVGSDAEWKHDQHQSKPPPPAAAAESAPSDPTRSSGKAEPCKVFIAGLPDDTLVTDLEDCFSQIGPIVGVELKKGFGFVVSYSCSPTALCLFARCLRPCAQAALRDVLRRLGYRVSNLL